MKGIINFLYSVLVVVMIFLILLAVLILNVRGEDNIPGPDFHDGSWQEGPVQENWLSVYLTLVSYFQRSENGSQIGGVEVYYNSELVMKAWGATFQNHKLDAKNAYYAIKQEDGSWKVGNKGESWWEIINEDEDEKVWFFVETESGLKEGRGFPKGNMKQGEIK